MERIIPNVIKVYQLYRRNSFETVVKASTEVIIVQFLTNIFQNLKKLSLMSGIQILKLPFKYLQKNIRVTVIDRAILIFTQLAEVSISYSGEVNHCRHLHPCSFRKLFHITYPFCRLSNPSNRPAISLLSVARSLNLVESYYKHKHLPY